MKRIICILILLFIPTLVYAKTCDEKSITLNSFELVEKTDGTSEISEGVILEDNNININLKMNDVGDKIIYKFNMKNNSSDEFEIDNNIINNNSEYFDYTLKTTDTSNIIKSNEEKEVLLEVVYKNEIPEEMYSGGIFKDNKNLTISLSSDDEDNIINPKTGDKIIFTIVILSFGLIVSIIAAIYFKKRIIMVFLLGVCILYPLYVNALCKAQITLESHIEVKQKKAILTTGRLFNSKIRNLATVIENDEIISDYSNIKNFKRQNTINEELKNEDHLVSAENSDYEIYAWFDTDTINFYTEGPSIYANENAQFMFTSLSGLEEFNVDFIKFDDTTNMNNMFSFCRALVHANLKGFNTSKVTNIAEMFYYDGALKTVDMSGWDTYNVTDMSDTFADCELLTKVIGIEDWDVTNVKTFKEMFFYCFAIERLDLKKWVTVSVEGTGLNWMFYRCRGLKYLDIRNFYTKNATSYNRMLGDMTAIESMYIDNFDSSNVTDMYYMFVNDRALKDIDLSSFDTNKLTNTAFMFHGDWALEKIYISDNWTTENVTYSSYMFYQNNSLTGEISNRYTKKPYVKELNVPNIISSISEGKTIKIDGVNLIYSDDSIVNKQSEDIIWFSKNNDILRANGGTLKAISKGEATIVVKSGIAEKEYTITVK